MTADADRERGNMEKINVRVPRSIVAAIDEEYERRGYTSRSEAIRDALRAWVDPPVRLSADALEDLPADRWGGDRDGSGPLDEVADRFCEDRDR